MTFLVCWARPDVALVAADTRVTSYEFADDGSARWLGYEDGERKILGTDDGYVAAGYSPFWTARALKRAGWKAPALDRWPALLRETAAAEIPAGDATNPGMAARIRERYNLLGIGQGAETFVADGFAFDGSRPWAQAQPGDVIAAGPFEIAAERQQAALAIYRTDVNATEDVATILAATARLFRAIWELGGADGLVSDDVEIGLLRRTAEGVRRLRVGPVACRELEEMSNEAL